MSKSLMFPKARMKNGQNTWISKGLFIETCIGDEEYVLFTLKEYNHKGYQSFPNIYFSMTENDPTEYEFAMSVFGSWEHWLVVADSAELKPVILKLREEKNVRQKAKVVKFMLNEVETKGKSSFAAAKLLLDKPWEEKPNPSQETKKQTAARRKATATEDTKVFTDSELVKHAKQAGITIN